MDRFAPPIWMPRRNLESVRDGYFDVVICNHVLEHLERPDIVARSLALEAPPRRRPLPRGAGKTFVEAAERDEGSRCSRLSELPGPPDPPGVGRPARCRRRARTMRARGDSSSSASPRKEGHPPTPYALAGIANRRYVPASVLWDSGWVRRVPHGEGSDQRAKRCAAGYGVGAGREMNHEVTISESPGPSRLRDWPTRVAAVGLLVLLSPVLGIIAGVIRATMGRPVVFSQVRIGQGERTFVMLKFRTMRPPRGSEAALLTDADRVTAVGRFLLWVKPRRAA